MMDSTGALAATLASAACRPFATRAQTPAKIALLSIGTDPVKTQSRFGVQFLDQLGQLGYGRGSEHPRLNADSPGGRPERLAEFVADLAGRPRVDIVVTTADVESVAAKQAMSTTPIVITLVQDPGLALASSRAWRPRAQCDGADRRWRQSGSKRLELLKAFLPLREWACLLNPTGPAPLARPNATETAARKLGSSSDGSRYAMRRGWRVFSTIKRELFRLLSL